MMAIGDLLVVGPVFLNNSTITQRCGGRHFYGVNSARLQAALDVSDHFLSTSGVNTKSHSAQQTGDKAVTNIANGSQKPARPDRSGWTVSCRGGIC
jgi:hypothetical protein